MAKYLVRWKRRGNGRWDEKTTNFKKAFRFANEKFAQGCEIEINKLGGINDGIPANAIKLVSSLPQ